MKLETDYLVVGAGAMGMAFADTIIKEQPNSNITLVDQRPTPGGHWLDAYPYVRLHQPASFYGVNSEKLETGSGDLSSKQEILAYYSRVLHRMENAGRVRFFGMMEHTNNGEVRSIVDPNKKIQFKIKKRLVDSTYMKVEVPSTTRPNFEVSNNVNLVPPNHLFSLRASYERYNIIGAGKTALDAICFLVDSGVPIEKIYWFVSQDSWFWNREIVQPPLVGKAFLALLNAVNNNKSADEAFLDLEKIGHVFRLDEEIRPTKWKCATISKKELETVRKIQNVIRKGRVKKVSKNNIFLERGKERNTERSITVDCSACGLASRPEKKIFSENAIILQSTMMCQQVFSASIIAKIESLSLGVSEKNALVSPVAHPEVVDDLPACLFQSFKNLDQVNRKFPVWMRMARLNGSAQQNLFSYLADGVEALKQIRKASQ